MKIMNGRGQGTVETILAVPIAVIALLVAFVLLDPISQTLFDTLDAANSAVISNIATIKIIIGLIGLILTAMVVMRIVNSFRQQPRLPPELV